MSHILSIANIHRGFPSLVRQASNPRSQQLRQAFTHAVSLEVVPEEQKALPSIHGLPSHVCDAWRWALVAGTVITMSDIQPMLVPNGVLLTATDIDTTTGIQILQFVPLALVQGIPLLEYMPYTDPDTQHLDFTWCAPFQAVLQLYVQQGLARILELSQTTLPTTMSSKFKQHITTAVQRRLLDKYEPAWIFCVNLVCLYYPHT